MEMTVMKKKPCQARFIRADGDGETTARRRHPKIVGKDPLNPKRGAPGQSLQMLAVISNFYHPVRGIWKDERYTESLTE
jgi:hypothetical protein